MRSLLPKLKAGKITHLNMGKLRTVVCLMDKVTKKLCSCKKEQKSIAVATDIGKGRIKVIDPECTEI